MATVLEKIADQIVTRTEFSPLAITRAKQAVIDTIGCMIAGTVDPATQSVVSVFRAEIAQSGASMVFPGGRASPSLAALINGTASHCLDFDDNFHPARAHASAVLVPALLSVATADNAITGMQFLRAYLAGLEAQAAVGLGVNPAHYNRGWHGTSTVGCIGTAAGVASLIGLGSEGIAQAMSIATSFAAGPKGQFGTPVKPLHAGMAARNAVEAAYLVQAGMTGRLEIMECPQGFLDLFGGDGSTGWEALSWSDNHIIETSGLVTKLHPCCASTHRVVDAARDLQIKHGFSLDDIEKIETKVGRSAVDNLAYPEPTNEMQARFSMQYCLAAALHKGALSLRDFTESAIFRPEIRRHMSKISMNCYSVEEERGVERIPHRVTVTLIDGRTFHTERLHANGSIPSPETAAQRHSKFSDCLEWAGFRVADIPEELWEIEHVSSLGDVLQCFEVFASMCNSSNAV